MDDPDMIRRRPDGSLDSDYYRSVAHQLRSATLHEWLRGLLTRWAGIKLTKPGASGGEA